MMQLLATKGPRYDPEPRSLKSDKEKSKTIGSEVVKELETSVSCGCWCSQNETEVMLEVQAVRQGPTPQGRGGVGI